MPSKTAMDIIPSMFQQYQPFRSKKDQDLKVSAFAEARTVARLIAHELIRRFGAKKVVLFGG